VLANGAVPGENVMPGKVVRQAYLGDARDYLVELDETSVQLRALCAGPARAGGEAVTVVLPPEACRIVAV
jgi:hypothetical protein